MKKPIVLIILDGWGVAPASRGNGISLAKTPNFNKYITTYFSAVLQASGEAVGLPYGEVGNSEVGHLNLGAGKIVYQNLPRINKSILDGSFFNNKVFLEACSYTKENNSALHLMGLVSNGGTHSFNEHLFGLLELAKKEKQKRVYIHAFLDGRDVAYNSGIEFIKELEEKINQIGIGKIATISGRFYAMDRDNHWDRIEKTFLAMTEGQSEKSFNDSIEAIQDSYDRNIFDEEFLPTVLLNENKEPITKIQDKDAVIFFNFRSDRARELTQAFVLPDFQNFKRPQFLKNLYFATMTEYEKDLLVKIAFSPEEIKMPLAKILSDSGLNQLHIAETEKYAHVTYFFNGGEEKPFKGQSNIVVPSPQISSYAEQPKMSAPIIIEKLLQEISKDEYDFIVVNFANTDMVGHTGNLKAVIQATEYIDECLKKIVDEILSKNGTALITADHGNAEEVINLYTGEIDKEHSSNPVPFILIGKQWENKAIELGRINPDLSGLVSSGVLADIAPTILKIMNISEPEEMTGNSLI
ncbi:2,3-bisphosphoglycerate-independent phosphoglycerate mutase [Candidatus Kuenenbacteria bacterium HGW-Kuenenbacteria-1]|uniref:2,3-bisphosphoglycerate-independent phosphoglycerate mutase n=1 Tax=Candidatus Kuenenbacteria bacterium HGW-Kuenenbacteria-1 TaxID=2013812 RepID=A0A2N1UPB5_9BACT|nr:MAG: 2,3-bisphosphoglycerate-independent phosphoglycerate mutase [Candidatus Kuenenbacteria bacterium HGW-Kuenenbacteria-1]